MTAAQRYWAELYAQADAQALADEADCPTDPAYCPVCAAATDRCKGHGDQFDPHGAQILRRHDDGDHVWCAEQ